MTAGYVLAADAAASRARRRERLERFREVEGPAIVGPAAAVANLPAPPAGPAPRVSVLAGALELLDAHAAGTERLFGMPRLSDDRYRELGVEFHRAIEGDSGCDEDGAAPNTRAISRLSGGPCSISTPSF